MALRLPGRHLQYVVGRVSVAPPGVFFCSYTRTPPAARAVRAAVSTSSPWSMVSGNGGGKGVGLECL
ncbi:hypothetical protein AB9C17_11235, partial [Enterobacter hormaechei]|uniref:hypothetical protein n=1 Tax=Enterobacter hormaechei TaxID=158836 RepID=UPI00350F705D